MTQTEFLLTLDEEAATRERKELARIEAELALAAFASAANHEKEMTWRPLDSKTTPTP